MKILVLYLEANDGEKSRQVRPAALALNLATAEFAAVAWRGDGGSIAGLVENGAGADGALLVLSGDRGDDLPVDERLVALLDLVALRQLAIAVDGAGPADEQARFERLAAAWTGALWEQGLAPVAAVPVRSADGDNLVQRSSRMPWYRGPALDEALRRFAARDEAADRPLRVTVDQDVAGTGDTAISGRLVSGGIAVGDRVLLSPLNRTAGVLALARGAASEPCDQAAAVTRLTLTLDGGADVGPGHIISRVDSPPAETDVFRARLVWGAGTEPAAGGRYAVRLNGARVPVTVQSVEGAGAAPSGDSARRNGADVVLRADRLVALDRYSDDPRTGHVVVLDGESEIGAGIVDMRGYADQRGLITVRATNLTRVEHRLTGDERARRNRHVGGVLWLTGLSGSGKSTLAVEAERALFDRGYHVYILDGDNVRHGLNANLGFSPEDRAENIRRVGEVAALFSAAGFIVVTAFISPYRSDRDRARAAAPDGCFHEVHVNAGLEVCERRDPKGLYRRARSGEIGDFTGISAPYEAPETPDLVVETGRETVAQSVARLVAYVEDHFALGRA